jgi:hypothetical protein
MTASGAGNRNRERASLSDVAHERDLAIHSVREIAADGQPETHAFFGPGKSRVHLNERLENPVDLLLCDAAPRVPDGDRDVLLAWFAGQAYMPSGGVNLLAFVNRLSRIC